MAKGLMVSSMVLYGAASIVSHAMEVSPATARNDVVPWTDAAATSPAGPALILVQQGRGGDHGAGPGGGGPTQHGLSEAGTKAIIMSLEAGEMLCGRVPSEYRADCLAQTFRLTANLARNSPEYVAASLALDSASREISRLVSENADPTAERVRSHGRTYRAVRLEAAPAVNARVEAVVAETETKLLRSAGSAGQAHYQRIAQAVGSTKRILRS